jgi:hypothetical protein
MLLKLFQILIKRKGENMARKIKQFRYYRENDPVNNYPTRVVENKNEDGEIISVEHQSLINIDNLVTGAIFSEYMPAI